MIDLDKDQALCDRATPGPWHLNDAKDLITQTSHVTRDVWTIPRTFEDMYFITAFNPEHVKEYIAEVRRLRDWQKRAVDILHCASFLSGPDQCPACEKVAEQLIEEAK